MTKTDKNTSSGGADTFIKHNPEWEGEVSHANKGGRPRTGTRGR